MGNRCALLTIALGFWLATSGHVFGQEVGGMYHVTGCRDSEMVVVTPALWASPERLRVVGRLAGGGPASQGMECQGAVVRGLSRSVGRDDTEIFEIRSIMNSRRGWLPTEHIGQEFPKERCREMFTEPVHINRCEA